MNQIRNLCLEDIPRVAEIHVLAFPQSALSTLGNEATCRYYHWLSTGPHDGLLLSAWMDDRLVGFSVGGVFRGALSGYLRRNRTYLVGRVLMHPWLLGNSLFVDRIRLSLRLLRPRTKPAPVPKPVRRSSFGILAIAVNPNQQGNGFGRLLMAETEKAARQGEFDRMQLTVSLQNQQAIRFYEQLGWQCVSENEQPWKGRMIKELNSIAPK